MSNVANTNLMRAANEVIEDRVNDCIKHCQDVTTVEGKPCKVTLEITITPNRARNTFGYLVKGKAIFSPREGFEGTVFASVHGDEVTVNEYDAQGVMDLPVK